MSDKITDELLPCPFCGKEPIRVSIATASCDGMVDGREVHNTIGMRPDAWNARAQAHPTDEEEVERRLEAISDGLKQAKTIIREGDVNYWLVSDAVMLEVRAALNAIRKGK